MGVRGNYDAAVDARALVILAAMPHLLVGVVLAGDHGLSTALLATIAWNLLPVAIGALLLSFGPRAVGIAWLLATTAGSAFAAWAGAISPHGATPSAVFLWMPACNILLVGPAGVVIAAIAQRW